MSNPSSSTCNTQVVATLAQRKLVTNLMIAYHEQHPNNVDLYSKAVERDIPSVRCTVYFVLAYLKSTEPDCFRDALCFVPAFLFVSRSRRVKLLHSMHIRWYSSYRTTIQRTGQTQLSLRPCAYFC